MSITAEIVHPNDVDVDDSGLAPELEHVGIAQDALDGLQAIADDRGVMPLPAAGRHSTTHMVFYRLSNSDALCRTRYNCPPGEAPDDELLARSMASVAAAAEKQEARAARRDAERASLDAAEAKQIADAAAAKAEAAEAVLAATDDEGGDTE